MNDLLHIIYKNADDKRASTGAWDFRTMLRPDLPKENIDGEAVQWAARRLNMLTVARKLLIVISDGAPVDDSTIMENGPDYLSDHLQQVVEMIATAGDMEIGAMGLGYHADDFYPISRYVEAPDELGNALVTMIEQMLTR